jgi:hypothetical protein
MRDRWRAKSRACSSLSFDIKGIVHKEFVLVGQIVSSAYYCNVLWWLFENVWRLRYGIWWWKNWLLHHDSAPSHTSFSPGSFLTKNKMTVIPHPPYFSLFPQLKIKLKGQRPPFWHNWRWLLFIPKKISGIISVRDRVDLRATVLLEGLGQLKNLMTPSGIELWLSGL